MQSCYQLTPDQLASSLAAGWTLVGGPYATSAICTVNCGSSVASSVAASSVASSATSAPSITPAYWCVNYYSGNQGPCPTSGVACFDQRLLTTVFLGDPFLPGTFVYWTGSDGLPCYGTLANGPYPDPATCSLNCQNPPPASSVSAASSVSSSSGGGPPPPPPYWCVSYYGSNQLPCPSSGVVCVSQANMFTIFGAGAFRIGEFIGFIGPGRLVCYGTITNGPYATAAVCGIHCQNPPPSSISATSSSSGGAGTVLVQCCATPIPTVLRMTITSVAICWPATPVTVTLVYQGNNVWQGVDNFCGGTWTLTCAILIPPQFVLTGTCYTQGTPGLQSCSPFLWTDANATYTCICGTCVVASPISVTITS